MRRSAVLVVIPAVTAALGVAFLLRGNATPRGDGNDPGRHTASGTPTGTPPSGATTAPTVDGLPSPFTSEQALSPGSADDSPLVAFGTFHSGRLVAVSLDTLTDRIRRGDDGVFPANGVSPTVGAPVTTARVGDAILVAATNQAQLVRLTNGFRQRDTLDIAGAVQGSQLRYGAIVPVGGPHVDVTMAFGSKMAVARVDVQAWKVVTSRVFDDRFAGFPRACLQTPGQLAVVSTGFVDFLHPHTLERLHSVPLSEVVGAACLDGTLVTTSISEGVAYVIDARGETVRTLTYPGSGTGHVIPDPSRRAVHLSEPETGRIVTCALTTGRCTQSDKVGRKPTYLTLVGRYLVVTIEADTRLGLLDAATLAVIGTVRVPDTPLTLLVVRP